MTSRVSSERGYRGSTYRMRHNRRPRTHTDHRSTPQRIPEKRTLTQPTRYARIWATLNALQSRSRVSRLDVTRASVDRSCPRTCNFEERLDERILSPHVAEIVVGVVEGEALFELSVAGGLLRMRSEIITKRQLVDDLWMTSGACVDVMRTHSSRILAEVKPSGRSWHRGVQALSPDTISQRFHRFVEASNALGLF